MADGYVHLKSAKSKGGKESPGDPSTPNAPEYPYGTRVNLDADHVKKVYGDSPPAVGEEHDIHARGKVTEMSDRDGEGKRLEIQITHMKPHAAKGKSVREDLEDAAAKKESVPAGTR